MAGVREKSWERSRECGEEVEEPYAWGRGGVEEGWEEREDSWDLEMTSFFRFW